MNRLEKLRLIRAGGQAVEQTELPFFWEMDNDGNFVAGDLKLTPAEVEKLKHHRPGMVFWVEEKVYNEQN